MIVPPTPGVTSALGILQVDLRHDLLRSVLKQVHQIEPDELVAVFDALESEARQVLEGERASGDQRIELSLDVRYYGQTPYMNMVLDQLPRDRAAIDAIVERYGEDYEREFGYRLEPDVATVEFVNARAAAIGVTADTELQRSAEATGRPEPRQVRSVFFEESGGFVDTPIYARGSLGKDARLAGPAIVEQDDTTLLLPPGTSRRGRPVPEHPHRRRERIRGGEHRWRRPARRTGSVNMEPTASATQTAPALRNDPITFEVLRNAFKAICNEASALIERVSYAPTITEGHDYSVSILTPDGRLVSHGQRDQAPHMGTFEASVQHLVKVVPSSTRATSSSTTTRIRAARTRTTSRSSARSSTRARCSRSRSRSATGPTSAARCTVRSTRTPRSATPRACGCRR